MTADFSQLSKLNPARTARYVLYQVQGEPALIVAPAAENNRGYFNAILKRSKKSIRRLRSGNISESMIRESRDEDRELYAQHILQGWEGVVDSVGAPAEFNADNALAFLRSMPNWMFDELRSFCGSAESFLEAQEMSAEDVEEQGKN